MKLAMFSPRLLERDEAGLVLRQIEDKVQVEIR
jgi:hypothetical protein